MLLNAANVQEPHSRTLIVLQIHVGASVHQQAHDIDVVERCSKMQGAARPWAKWQCVHCNYSHMLL
jgi:hypothetical protein